MATDQHGNIIQHGDAVRLWATPAYEELSN